MKDAVYLAGLRRACDLVMAIAPSSSSFFNQISLSILLRFNHFLCQIRRRSLEVYVWNVFDGVSEIFLLLLDPFKAVHSVYVCVKAGLQCMSL